MDGNFKSYKPERWGHNFWNTLYFNYDIMNTYISIFLSPVVSIVVELIGEWMNIIFREGYHVKEHTRLQIYVGAPSEGGFLNIQVTWHCS